MKFLILTNALISIVLLSSLSHAWFELPSFQLRGVKYCHLNHVMACLTDLRAFTAVVNGTGMPQNDYEMDQLCGSEN